MTRTVLMAVVFFSLSSFADQTKTIVAEVEAFFAIPESSSKQEEVDSIIIGRASLEIALKEQCSRFAESKLIKAYPIKFSIKADSFRVSKDFSRLEYNTQRVLIGKADCQLTLTGSP